MLKRNLTSSRRRRREKLRQRPAGRFQLIGEEDVARVRDRDEAGVRDRTRDDPAVLDRHELDRSRRGSPASAS